MRADICKTRLCSLSAGIGLSEATTADRGIAVDAMLRYYSIAFFISAPYEVILVLVVGIFPLLALF